MAVDWDSPTEQWRTIPGHPGYEASTLGRLRSWRRYANGRILRPSLEASGYYKVRLRTAKASQWVHRLVALAFLGDCPEGQEVRHLDGDSMNNAAANLAYGTHSENMRDRTLHGTVPARYGTHCPRGHEYGPERVCETCRFAAKKAWVRKNVGRYVTCAHCGVSISFLNLTKHQRTRRCATAARKGAA